MSQHPHVTPSRCHVEPECPRSTPEWRDIPTSSHAISERWLEWLASRDSLTERLMAAAGEGRFHVRLLDQYLGQPWPDEAEALGLAAGQQAWLREVALCVDEVPWVVARSVAPRVSDQQAPFAGLGENSLGSWLFQQPDLRRSPIEISRISRPIHGYRGIWQRRSLFCHGGWVMLVQESFLPAMAEALSLDPSPG
ncbi:chorismate lyase [Halomonas denitrificans]|uniref:chorismate--pyruvate lyase family protein n=1 Tax=Halomonas TaxID=2745 RepID=UPI001C963732|nr:MULTISPECIES: chorismate lyase [Halomonas]MBY6031156.1 chorismate lyase [Halomonas sp. DP8Y7-1]MCA0974202.1 chorismate lyase [Halomonas denitrificans]MED5295842.1 chorismate lyase [Pseudomonadota bacterium]